MTKANMNIEMLKRAVLEKKLKEQLKKRGAETHSLHLPITKADRHMPLPLSFAQQRLWFLGQLDSAASQAYHIPVALSLKGKLDKQALASALDNLVTRQESLRTHFKVVDGQPYQEIMPPDTGFPLTYLDLRSLDKAGRSARVDELAECEVWTPFDLTQGPLIRGQLLQLSDKDHVLLLTQHHIISDGWSVGVLIRELAAFYQAALTGQNADLPPLPIQYADYAVWQHKAKALQDELQGNALAVQRDFWYRRLKEAPDLLELPTDRPRPPVQRYAGSQIPLHFEPELLSALKTLGQNHDTTLFMTLITAWALVLSRLSGQDDIVIGIPTANRTRRELEGLVGFFVNTLAIRIESGQCQTIAELLAHVRERTLTAYAHQDLPFEQVVEALQPERSLSYSPVFQVMMALNNTPTQKLELPELDISVIEQPQYSTHFDLTLSLNETDSDLAGELEYAIDLFDQDTVVRIAGYLNNTLKAMVTDMTQAISFLPILPTTEQQQLLVDFNATQADFPQDALIHTLFEQQAAQAPDAVAVVFEDQRLSYGELNRRANRLAHYLIDLGVKPDDRVAICSERSLDMVIGLLAILKAGGAYLPLDPVYPAERLDYMLADAAPTVLLTQTAQADKLTSTTPIVLLDKAPDFATQPDSNPLVQGLTSRHLAYVIYTSGSTGQPKGVMVEHRNVLRLIINNGFADIGSGDCVAHAANISFDAATWEIWSALLGGGRLCVIPHSVLLEPACFCDALMTNQVNTLWLTAGLFNEYLPHLEPLLGQLRYLIVGGDVLDPEKIQRVQSATASPACLMNGYGPTETTTFAATYAIPPYTDTPRSIPIGRPIANTQIYILDKHGQPVPFGVSGEIHIGGAGVARGYLNHPELTAERFIVDPFSTVPDARMYKTGDLGRWLPDGNIEYLGRNDFQVKIRGFRIELGEIETQLAACDGVREAVVIAREDAIHENVIRENAICENKSYEKRLVAYLVPQPDMTLTAASLREQLQTRLADYMLPSAFVMLDTFPLTPNGKLDRKALPAPDQSAMITRDYEAPTGEVEIVLANIWQELLGLEQIGRHDHFFELGGHSLIAVSLIERLRSRGYTLEVRSVFSIPRLADMARAIQAQSDTPDSIVPPNRIPDGCTDITPEMLPLVTLSQTDIDTIAATVPGGAANVQDIYPLAPLQEGILFHYQLEENHDAYLSNNLLAFDTHEALEAFLHALQQVIDRHDILRTAVFWQELSQPVQVVCRQAHLHVISFVPASAKNIQAQLQANIATRLDISQAPLFAAYTTHDPNHDEWLLALSFHHLVCDHVSLALIVDEIRLLLLGQADSLPPPLPYRNFIAQTLSVSNAVHEAYFRERLADVDEPTAPFGLLNVQGDGQDVAEARLPLDTALAKNLRTQARQLGVSPSVLFHVAWAQVLAHLSGCENIVFGTVLLGRLQGSAGADKVMGLFINTLPIRISLTNHNVSDVVQATAQDLAALLTHEQTPLALAQRCSGVAPPMPLFSVLFNYRHNSPDHTGNSGFAGMRVLMSEERTNYPLTLSVDDDGNGFSLVAQAVDGIDPSRIVNYLNTALSELVAALTTEPLRLVRDLPVLPATERQQLLVDFNATQADFPQDALIHALFEQQVAQTPDAVAVVFEDQSLSYDEINRRANRLAHHLIGLGVQPDDRVAICVERSPDMVIGLLAILKAGGAYLPLDPAYPAERLGYMLADAAPVALLTHSSQTDMLTASVPVLLLDKAAVFASQPDSNPLVQGLTSRHLAYIIYTSGSTGQPKGVMAEHRGLCNLILNQQNLPRQGTMQQPLLTLTPESRVLQFASSGFDACIWECSMALLSGARLYLARRDDILPGATLSGYLERHAISHVLLSPTALAAMDSLPDTLQTLLVGGEACPASLVKRWSRGRQMLNAYGPTEITVCATLYPCRNQEDKTPPIGRPIANTQIYILDKHGQPVPLGVCGEIHIGGTGVARGYLNRPELTAARFLTDPFSTDPNARMYKTGDLGRWLPDGNIEYLGRNDFQVKIRGFRIELGEIETQLAACDGVREAVVIAREDAIHENAICENKSYEKRLVAYLVPQPDMTLTPASLREQLKTRLADYMIPSAFVMLDAFPLTPNGKLDRKALPAPDQSAVITHAYEAPEGEVETVLAEIWQTLLGLEQVGRHDHFFELGGHSLIAVSLIERLRSQGYTLDVRSVFSAPRLADMAQAIQAQSGASVSIVPPNLIPDNCLEITPEMLPLVTLSQADIDTIAATVPGGAANVQDIYPLAPLQEGILFHYQLEENHDAYLSNGLLAFDSRALLEDFLNTLQQVIDRHDILRTAICWQGLNQPVQVVWRQASLSVIPFVPVSSENVPAQLQAHLITRLNINHAPLLAAHTVHDPDKDEWLLALNYHHLVVDNMTMMLIMEEIRRLLQGQAETLPQPLPYRNFIAQTLSVPAAVHEAYFREQLADIDEPTAPFGLLNVQSDGKAIAECHLFLDSTLANTLRVQARQLGVSASVLFHVACAQVLSHLSGREEVVFGTVLLGRLQGSVGADQTVGLFINTLPIRISLGHQDVLTAVQTTARNLAALLEHEQTPLALAQRCSGVLPPVPLFSVLFNYRHNSLDATKHPILEGMRSLTSESRTSYPLAFSVNDDGNGFSLEVQAVDGIDPNRVANYLHTTLNELVTALVTEPQRPIRDLPVLPIAERQQLLVEFNTTQADFPQDALIHQLFEQQVAQTPDAVAVVFEDQSLSYDEINRRANRLAHHLIGLGVQPDDRVAICVERSPDMVIGLLAILKAGGAYLPLDPAYPAERLDYMLADATPTVLLTQTAQADKLTSTAPIVLLDKAPDFATQPDSNPLVQGLTSRHLAYIIYTSGSTGQPKGVMAEHRGLCNLILNQQNLPRQGTMQQPLLTLTPESRVLQFASSGFDACIWECSMALLSGARLYLARRDDILPGATLSGYLERHAISHVLLSPTALAAMDSLPDTLQTLLVGGEACPASLVKRWSRGRQMLNAYGPTEITVCATLYPCRNQEDKTPPIGRPIANTQIYILDKHGQPVPLGVCGEIHIGGAGVARGYLNRPELTAERFLTDPFSTESNARMYKTGDLGRWLPDGNIEYLGRNDFQVKIRGFRIELGEIETQLAACDGVREAIVIAREDTIHENAICENKSYEKRLVAYLVPQPDMTLTPASLREQLKTRLADYMLPSAFVMLDAFPLTPNGKLDRKALPAPDQSAVITHAYEAPEGDVETVLAEIWQTLLGLEQVGRHDHFFELGGHSLIAVSLIERLRSQGYTLDVRSVFSAPRLADMALAIQTSETPICIVPPNLIPDGCTDITPDLLPLVTLSQADIDTIVAGVPGGAANVQDIYPLSPLQEGILFHHQLQENHDAYLLNSLLAFDTRETLDAFLSALQQVIDRHDILRTAVCWQGVSQPVQVVWRQSRLPVIPFVPESKQNIPAQLQSHVATRLDISQAPLFAAYTAHDPSHNEWLLALSFHHLVSDHMTLALIMDEIQRLLQGQAELLPRPRPYRNFIAQTLNVPAEEHEAYFRERLSDIDEPTAPFGLLNVQGDGQDVAEARLPLDTTLAHTLRAQARQLGVSPSVLFHVAFAQVLARTSGRDDVVFGTVLLGRLQGSAGADQVMGLFINTLPIRVSLVDRNVSDVVQATAQDLAALLTHEQTPLALAQRCSGVVPPMPLFSVLFNYRHNSPDHADNPGWNGIRLLSAEERTNYPLTLSVDDDSDNFNLMVQAVDGIDPSRIVNYLHTALGELVAALATAPQRPMRDLPILSASEHQQLLVDFNATQADFPQDALIHELFEQQVARTPDAVAVIFEDQHLSYGELNRRANRLAHYLIEMGVQPDERVAICVERSLEMMIGLLAILKAGGAYVPLDPAYPAERLSFMLEDSAPVVLLTQTALTDIVGGHASPVLILDDTTSAVLDNQPDQNPDARALALTPQHLAYVIYTSGSTGQPKGVMNSHRALCNRLVWMQDAYGLTADDRVLQKTPFSFDVSVWEFFWPLLYGARLVMARPEGHKDVYYLAELIDQAAITTLHFVPSMLQQFVQGIESPYTLPSLRRVICSGEALPAELQQRFFTHFETAELHNLYGPTEAAIDVTYWACRRDDQRHFVPIGQPIANTQMYILDKYGKPVPLGVSGEIHIGGAGVARGYLNRPELTAERFIADPFSTVPDARLYKTGDLGRWLPDGNIEYLGRNDFQVKVRGFRIELGEIEARLAQCPGVQEAVVIAREGAIYENTIHENERGEKRLVAYLRPECGVELVPAELRRELAQQLAEYMIPSAFVTLDTFPLTPNGKLDRKALPAPDQSAVITHDYEAPEGEVETVLAEIWQALLGLEQVGRHDHFFELGGHSLIAVSLIERLRSRGYTLEARNIFSAPQLADMARAIQARPDIPAYSVPPNRIFGGCTAITPDLLPLVTLSQADIDTVVATVSGGAANVQDIYPLSPLQEGILFHHQLQENHDAYLLNSLLAFDSKERLNAFLSALQQVIDRHDILRTAVCWQGLSQPVQVVWRQARLPVIPFVPASSENIQAQLQSHIATRLNISQAPLFAAYTAYDPNHDEWLLALSFHHLVSDHMTLALIMDEIQRLLQGQAELLPRPLPYRNFIAQTLSVPAEEHEAYFRERLAEIDEPTAPFDLLNVQGDGQSITETRLFLDTTLVHTIRTQARQLGISPSVLFHVACAQMLANTCGREEVVFGTVLLGRLHGSAGADQVMGLFINTLPIRVSLADRNALEVVKATARDLADLLTHEQTPLALAQRCSSVIPPIPLFSVLFNYRHSSSGRHDSSGHAENSVWAGTRLLTSAEQTNYPLTISVDDDGNGFSLVAQAVAGIDPSRIVNYLHTALSELVAALATEPLRPVRDLPVLPATERQQLLVDFNATQADFPQDALIHQLFEQQVAQTPDAVAVVFEDQSLSYDEINRRANRLAHYLIDLGVQPDDRVAICVERSPDMVIGLLAILKAGGAYLPLDPAYPAERLGYMLADAAPTVLLTQTAQADKLTSTAPIVLLDKAPDFATQPDSNPLVQGLTSRHLAYIIYTSGSTGQPKGVMAEHRSLCNLILNQQNLPRQGTMQQPLLTLTPESRVLQFASSGFDACIWECSMALLSGARLYLARRDDILPGATLSGYLERHAISHVLLSPTALAAMDSLPDTLQTLLVGGEACPASLVKRWSHGRQMLNAYGPTEITVCATLYPCRNQEDKTPPIGRPIANTQIYILDKHGQPVPLGVCGEIHIGGAGVARGYLNRPELTAARFLTDPFSTEPNARMYKTGDLGRWLPDGNIEYLGRNDFQVKIRGFRIELGEIETQLAACDGVREAIVIAREDAIHENAIRENAICENKSYEKRLVAYLVPQPDMTLTAASLREQLQTRLADYMLPSAFVTLDAFPLTPNGKLDRKALPAPDQTAVVSSGYEPPQGETEEMLAQIWQELLRLEQVGRHDNFFELGGHSLIAVRLLSQINKQGMVISLATLFAHPTLCDLASTISHHSTKPSSPLAANPVPLRPAGNLPPLFLIHEVMGDLLVYSRLLTLLPTDLPIYGLQALGLHTVENPPASIEELAAYHIEAIRRVQPHGPYHLAGWSIGGTIAYEIALQLADDGEEVGYVGMIDSYNLPECETGNQRPVDEQLENISRLIQYLEENNPDLADTDELYQLRNYDVFRWLPADLKKEDMLLYIRTLELIIQLNQRYAPSASSLPVHLYTADDLTAGFDNWHGWRDIVGEHSVLQPIGGDHYTILQFPCINQLADAITGHLLSDAYSPDVIIQQGVDSVPPLFCIPGAGASASAFIELALALPPQLPVHALQSRGLTNTHLPPHISVEGTARDYIKALRQVQPYGPYHLLGHSFGGWLAFEIALQLQAQGEIVAALTLVDSDAPDLQRDNSQNGFPKVVGRIETLMELIGIYDLMLPQPLTLTRQDFAPLTADEQLRLLLQALINAGVFPANTEVSLLQGIVQVMQANLNTNYAPHIHFDGPVYLVSAKEDDRDDIATHENGWRNHVTQLNTVSISGNHMTMLSNPHVRQLATLLCTEILEPK